MRFKKVVPVMFLLLVILTISAVSATDDNSTSDTLTVDENPDEIQMDESNDGEDILLDNGSNSKSDPSFSVSADDIQYGEDAFIGFTLPHDATGNVSVTVDGRNFGLIVVDGSASLFIPNLEIGDHIVSAEYGGDSNYNPASNSTTFKVTDPYGFDALQSLIDATPEGDTLTLTNNYTCHGTPVTISRPITIDGDGYYLLSDSASQMIDIISDNVTLINLNMMNVVSGSDSAIIVNGKNCKVINSTFLNCSATSNGAAIYWNGSDGLISWSNFLSCSGNNGGAVYVNALNCTVEESTFKMCNAEYGGAIYLGKSGVVSNCSFANNLASVDGGAILSRDAVSNVSNCIFVNNSASVDGGATYNCDNINCTFEDNSNPQVYLDEKYRKNATITVSANDVMLGENITVDVIFFDNITTNVTITFNGDDSVMPVENGRGQLNISTTSTGVFEVIATFNGNEIYHDASVLTTVEVTKKTPTINLTADDVVYGENVTIYVSAPADVTGNVSVIVGGVEYTAAFLNGEVHFLFSGLNVGNYIYNVYYHGDNNYNPANISTNMFNVAKATTVVNVTADDVVYGEDAIITVNLASDATGNVTVIVNNINYIIGIVDGQGALLIPDLNIGVYNVSAEYGGDSNYNPASNSTTFKVTDPYGFDALKSLIDATPEGDTLTLTNNYTCHGTPLTISRPITIDGDGYYLLSDLASQMINIISDNVTLINLNIMSAGNGSASAIIVNGKNCKVINSSFSNCSSTSDGAAIYWNGAGGLISNSVFSSCSGNNGGAVYINALNCSVENSNFNKCNAQYGGAIYVAANYAVIKDSIFYNDNATYRGGAIYYDGEYCNIAGSQLKDNYAMDGGAVYYNGRYCTISDSIFENNLANYCGGAIYWAGSSSLNNSVLNCMFLNNTAYGISSSYNTRGGGAIYWSLNGRYGVVRDSQFINNSVQYTGSQEAEGGAILWDRCYNGCIDNCTFEGNYVSSTQITPNTWIQGGALFLRSHNFTVSNSVFRDCWSDIEAGAVYVSNVGSAVCNPNVLFDNVIFINNTAKSKSPVAPGNRNNLGGGAVQIKEIGSCWFINCEFINNTASQGGAYSHVAQVMDNNHYVINCTFTGNNATDGNGGSIYADQPIRLFNITVRDSTALQCGGGAYITNLIEYDNLTFINNHAQRGGGLYWNQSNTEINNMIFINNTADEGGAVYLIQDVSNVSYSNFTDNRANNGGAIYAYAQSNIIYNNFDNNEAVECGGAIYVRSSNVNISYNNFNNNLAVLGGAVYAPNKNMNVSISNSIFEKNHASDNGGAIYNCAYQECVFKDNSFPETYVEGESPKNTTIIVSANNVFIGENITVDVTFSDDITANVNLTFEGDDFDDSIVWVENGKGQLNVSSTNAGLFKVTAIFYGNGIYSPVSNSTLFSVLKRDLNVEVDLNESEGVILITVPEDASDVNFEINNKITRLDKSAKINIKDFKPGKHEYAINFNGNDVYNPFSKTATLEIHRHIPEISINSRDIQYGVTKNIGVVLPDNMVNNVTLTLYCNEEILFNGSKTLNQGIATLDVTGLDIGVYTVNVNYTGDINYYDFSKNITFSMLPKITYTSEITIEDDVEVILEFSNASGRVGLILNGEEDYLTQQIKNNKINFTFSTEDLFHGNHTIAFEYKGKSFDENLFNYFDSKTNTYRPIQYKLTILPQVFSVPKKLSSNDDGVVTLTFPDDAEGNLTVFVDGVEVMVKEVVNGIVTLDLSAYKDGNYKITFVYSGDRKYASFVQDSDANLHNTIPANIVASDFAVIYSAGTTYSVKVCTNSGKAVNNAKVIFFINGKAYKTVYTNSNGIAGAAISIAPGTYKITSNVNSLSNTKTLTVKHVIALKKVKVKRSAKKLILTASLKKVNGKYLKKKKVTFKFNGKKYKAKTNKKGVAKVTINKKVLKKLKKGKKVKYQATYLKDTVKRTVKVKK